MILRGVSLLGVAAAATPRSLRLRIWNRLTGDLVPRHLERICTRTLEFEELPNAFEAYLNGKITGRTVVRIETSAGR